MFTKPSMSRLFLSGIFGLITVVVLWFVWWSTDLFGYYEKQDISHFHYVVTDDTIDVSVVKMPDKSIESIQLEIMYDDGYIDLLTNDMVSSSDVTYSLASQEWTLIILLSKTKEIDDIAFSIPFVSRSVDTPILLSEAIFWFLDGSKLYGSIRRL